MEGEAEVQKEGGNIQLPNAKQRDDAKKTRAGEIHKELLGLGLGLGERAPAG